MTTTFFKRHSKVFTVNLTLTLIAGCSCDEAPCPAEGAEVFAAVVTPPEGSEPVQIVARSTAYYEGESDAWTLEFDATLSAEGEFALQSSNIVDPELGYLAPVSFVPAKTAGGSGLSFIYSRPKTVRGVEGLEAPERVSFHLEIDGTTHYDEELVLEKTVYDQREIGRAHV